MRTRAFSGPLRLLQSLTLAALSPLGLRGPFARFVPHPPTPDVLPA